MSATISTYGQMKIRKMKVEDAQEVALIHTLSWQYAYKGIIPQKFLDEIDIKKREENWVKGMLEDKTLIRLVAEDKKGRLLGFVCGLNNRDKNSKVKGELWAIYVLPVVAQKGVGRQLFTSFKNELVKRGILSMNVWVLEENKSARHFYEAMGGTLDTYSKKIEIGGKQLVEVSYVYKFKRKKGYNEKSKYSKC